MEIKKVIIWGHKLHTHTHSYIHNGYFKAFKKMGFETYWLDNKDDIRGMDFENALFFTEDQVQQNIPLVKNARYVLHHCKTEKYDAAGCTYINLCNYVNDCRLGKSYNYPGGTVEKITYYAYWDKENKALYQPWATDLMPDEIGSEPLPLDPEKKAVYYIGSIWSENKSFVKGFEKACKKHGKKFIPKAKVSDEEARQLVRDSYIAPDIRGEHHLNVGYIPCRIFKNISYGVIPATNSGFIRDFFGDNSLPYATDTFDLFEANESYLANPTNLEHSKQLMAEVKEHHTYIKRVETILSLIS